MAEKSRQMRAVMESYAEHNDLGDKIKYIEGKEVDELAASDVPKKVG